MELATAKAKPGVRREVSRRHTALFFLVNLFLCSWHLYEGMNDNIVSRAAMVAAITEDGTLRIDEFHEITGDKSLINGHYYSDKAPLPAFIVLPFWWAADRLGWVDRAAEGTLNVRLLRLGGFLCGSLPFAIIATLLWRRLHRTVFSRWLTPSLLAVLSLFGSFLFVFSGSWFGHLIGTAFLLGAFIAFEGKHFLTTGVLAASAVLCEYTLVIFPLCWMMLVAVRAQWRDVMRIGMGALPLVVLLLAYNGAITGSAFSIGYDHLAGFGYRKDTYGFGLIDPAAVFGLTLSDYRGLFCYMPVLLPALIALFMLPGRQQLWKDPLLVPALILFLLVCAHGMWWGGWTYGPRHLTAVGVLLAFRSFPALQEVRWGPWVFWPTALFGIICAFAAKSTIWFSCPDTQRHPLTELVFRIAGTFHSWMQWPHYLWHADPALCTRTFLVLFVIVTAVLWHHERRTFAN